jgi:hypothetical protein
MKMKHLGYVGYHTDAGYALLSLKDSIGKQRAVIAPSHPGCIDFFRVTEAAFNKTYTKCGLWKGGQDIECEPQIIAAKMLATGLPITKSAIGHIEGALKMDTKGKSTEQIRKEVVRLSDELPKAHPLRDVPKSYPDRGQAIAAYTAMRQAIFAAKTKESNMSKKTAPTKSGVEAEAQKPSKAKVTKTAAPEPTPEPKAKKEKVKREPKDDNSSYVVAGEAAKVKNTEELGMHESSVRTQVLGAIMKSKAKGGVAFATLVEVAGDKTRGAIAYLVKRGFIAVA